MKEVVVGESFGYFGDPTKTGKELTEICRERKPVSNF